MAPVGTMGPLLRRLLLAALLQLAPAQVRASRHPARPPCPSQGWRKWGGEKRPRPRVLADQTSPESGRHPLGGVPPHWPPGPSLGPLPCPTPFPGRSRGAELPRCLCNLVRCPVCPLLTCGLQNKPGPQAGREAWPGQAPGGQEGQVELEWTREQSHLGKCQRGVEASRLQGQSPGDSAALTRVPLGSRSPLSRRRPAPSLMPPATRRKVIVAASHWPALRGCAVCSSSWLIAVL